MALNGSQFPLGLKWMPSIASIPLYRGETINYVSKWLGHESVLTTNRIKWTQTSPIRRWNHCFEPSINTKLMQKVSDGIEFSPK